MNLEHEKNRYKGKELTDLNSGKNNDQYYVRGVDAICAYFVQTGCCRYGSLCRFIHPEKRMVWNPSTTSQDFGMKCSSLDLQRQIPLLGFSKAEASGQVVHGEDQQKAGRPICQVFGEVQQNAGSPVCRVSGVDQQKAGSSMSRAVPQVLPRGGIPIHVPYRIPFPEKFTIAVGPTGLPLRAGRPVCKYYSHFGLCKYGIGCQDDHPTDFKSIAVPVPRRSRRNPHK